MSARLSLCLYRDMGLLKWPTPVLPQDSMQAFLTSVGLILVKPLTTDRQL